MVGKMTVDAAVAFSSFKKNTNHSPRGDNRKKIEGISYFSHTDSVTPSLADSMNLSSARSSQI